MYIKKAKHLFIAFLVVLFSTNTFAESIIKTEYNVKSGDNITSILKKNYVKSDDVNNLIYKTKDSNLLTKLKIGQKITIYKEKSGKLKKLILDLDKVNAYVASYEKNTDSFNIRKGVFKTDQMDQYVIGTVTYSVIKTLKEMGLNKDQIKDFKDMFANTVDLKRIKKGTKLIASYTEHYIGNEKVQEGELNSAEVSYGNSISQVFAFNDYKGVRAFYLKNGEPISEEIKRDPLASYTRVSSEFKPSRMHPVLGKIRAHKGTDYAAKSGTPIYAAASGKIALKDTQKGYGNVIVINHSDGYSTLYAHMKNFKKGVYSGKDIKKGDIIGYVGSTGISTGNHLHFEIRKNGKYLNPRKVDLPSGSKIARSDVQKFINFTKRNIEGSKIAKLNYQKEGKKKFTLR